MKKIAITVEELQIVFKAEVAEAAKDIGKLHSAIAEAAKQSRAPLAELGKAMAAISAHSAKPMQKVSEEAKRSAQEVKKVVDEVQQATAKPLKMGDYSNVAAEVDLFNQAIEENPKNAQKAFEVGRQYANEFNSVAQSEIKPIPVQVDAQNIQQDLESVVEQSGIKTMAAQLEESFAKTDIGRSLYAKLDFIKAKTAELGEAGKASIGKIAQALSRVAKESTTAGSKVVKMGTQIKKVGHQSAGVFGKLGQTIKRVVGMMVLRKAIRDLFSGVADGFKSISAVSTRANASLSGISGNMLYLKNSLSSALMPIVTALTPVISYLTDKIANLFRMIGMLSARVFNNATTFVSAKKAAVDYADGMKKVQGQLARMDELNIIKSNDDGGSGLLPGEMFEEIEIPESTLQIGDKIRGVLDGVKTTIEEYQEPILGAVVGVLAIIGKLGGFSGILAKIAANGLPLPAIIGLITAAFINVYNSSEEVREKVALVIEKTKQIFTDLWQNVLLPIFTHLGETVKDLWNNHLEPLLEKLFILFLDLYNEILAPLLGFIVEKLGPHIANAVNFVIDVFAGLLKALMGIIDGILMIFGGIIKFISGVFSKDWEKAWEGIKEIFAGVIKAIKALFQGVIDFFTSGVKSAASKIGSAVSGAFKGKSFTEEVAFTANTSGFDIPKLAKGGVLKQSTVFEGGEYAGARSNPEIVTPQSLMYETFVEANAPLVAVLVDMVERVVTEIRNKDNDVYIDGEPLHKSVVKHNKSEIKRTGNNPLYV